MIDGNDLTSVTSSARSVLRDRWSADDGQVIVAAVNVPPEPVDAMFAVWATGLAAETGRCVRVVVDPQARAVERALALLQSLGQADRLIVDEAFGHPEHVLAGCDGVLLAVSRAGAGGVRAEVPDLTAEQQLALPGFARYLLEAGLPIIAEAAEPIRSAFGETSTVTWVAAGSARAIARELCRGPRQTGRSP